MDQVERRPILSAAAGVGLCLHLPGCCPEGAACSTARAIQQSTTAPTPPSPAHHDQQTSRRPLTIVYGDRACTVDVTEAQAREILSTAQLSAEPTALASSGTRDGNCRRTAPVAGGSTCAMGSAYPPGTVLGQPMKGSLRRFLEKRADRLRDASGSPYPTVAKPRPPPSAVCQELWLC